MHIYHITINSIDYERRILNQACTAQNLGYKVFVMAHGAAGERHREIQNGLSLIRLKTGMNNGGPLKFLIFNIKLFFTLILKPVGIIHCHDLWVLPASALLSLLKNCPLIYDAHEYYAGLEVFTNRYIRRKLWLLCEWLCMNVVDVLLTISEPLGELYRKRYSRLKRIEIIRNLSMFEVPDSNRAKTLPIEKKAKNIVFHGHFKPGRGLENLIRAMELIENANLILIGGGELKDYLSKLANKKKMQNKVRFIDYIQTDLLISTIAQADIGAVLFESGSLNYANALPNKLFEYIMAGVPILGSNINTIASYINKYEIGKTVDPTNHELIAASLESMIRNESRLNVWKNNCLNAAKELNWDKEAIKLMKIYEETRI